MVSHCALNLFLETRTISSFRLFGSDRRHDALQFFSTNCIICLCSDFPLFCILEGKGIVIFAHVIHANPGVELQLYPCVSSEGDVANGEI